MKGFLRQERHGIDVAAFDRRLPILEANSVRVLARQHLGQHLLQQCSCYTGRAITRPTSLITGHIWRIANMRC